MRRLLIGATALALAATTPSLAGPSGAVTVTKTTHNVTVQVGPDNKTKCNIVGDLYVPSTATKAKPAPVIMTTNGFGGSKDDQADIGMSFGKLGYIVFSYSGLGFGGSGCNIQLDDPDWDGKAGSQLITYLAALPNVKKDKPGDPRIGMIGGSYGGGVQFATASVDRRLDTIVPLITWHDLAYSLTPNNVAFGAQNNGAAPGVPKIEWTELFFAVGLSQPAKNNRTTPVPPSQCPGFDPRVCPNNLGTAARGYPDKATLDLLQHASVATYIDKIRIPTMLLQGEADTLFNLNEAIATYRALKARRVPVKLVFQSWGHSVSAPRPGELDRNEPEKSHQGRMIKAWFDKWLKGARVSTGPEFEYFRPWVKYSGIATPAYGSARQYPIGKTQRLYFSGSGDVTGTGNLVGSLNDITPGETHALAGPPGSYSETSAVQSTDPISRISPADARGTYAAYTSAKLARDVDVVGVPTVDITISDPGANSADPATQTTVVAKLYDVAPDGSVTLAHRLVSPARLSAGSTHRIYLPGIVHRFAKGHQLRVVLAMTDVAYTTARTPHIVTFSVGGGTHGALTLPVAG